MKKWQLFVLTFLLALGAFSAASLAASNTISANNDDYNLAANGHGNGDTITIADGLNVTLVGDPAVTYTNFSIVCGEGVTLTLDNVNIDNELYAGVCPVSFTGSGNTLNLKAGTVSTLRGGSNMPAVLVESGTALTIQGSGTLDATGGYGSAGIGSTVSRDAGSITINAGTVIASGTGDSAGIGTGENGGFDAITIAGGSVTAQGGANGAGIGCAGVTTASGQIKISGGNVTATGGNYAPGIGQRTGDVDIVITGGTVNATGGCEAAGIGGGQNQCDVTLSISGGRIYTIGGSGDFFYPWDIGYGMSGTSSVSISGSAAVFLGRNNVTGISTATHSNEVFSATPSSVYGFSIPAEWTSVRGAYLRPVTLSYSTNGSGDTAPVSVTRLFGGASVAVDGGGSLALAYYHFDGWNTIENGSGTDYAAGAAFTFEADTTLYAQWEVNTYTVAYDANGGGGTTATSMYTCDVAQALTVNGFTREHYAFAGWATSREGDVVYTDGQSVSNLTAVNGGTVTLYAQWTSYTYTVAYDANGGAGTTAASMHTCDVAKALTANGFTREHYAFAGWATSAAGVVVYSDAQSVKNLTTVNGGTVTLYAQWTELTLSSSISSGTIYTGGRIVLTPSVDGGTWDWDHDFFTATFNSPATFTALKAGTSTITYTVGGETVTYDVTIEEAELPSTGQDFIWVWLVIILAGLTALAGVLFFRKKRMNV